MICNIFLFNRFISDKIKTENRSGFMIKYQIVHVGQSVRFGSCGGDFTTLTGILTSPSFPEEYPGDQSCSYTISIPAEKYVNVTFMIIDIKCEAGSDYLEMRDGNSGSAPLMMWNYCGNGLTSLQTTQNSLWIK